MLQRIQERSLNIKVQLGVDVANKHHAKGLIDTAANIAMKCKHLILGMSVGNERIHFGPLWAQDVKKHAQYANEKYGIPVTYNFVSATITHSKAGYYELC